jgi:dTDP-4-dehydrorhamnose reductase
MKVWITGASGLLGAQLKQSCDLQGISNVATTRLEVDVTDFQAVKSFVEKTRPTHVVNCAAYTAVDLAESESEKAFAINALGPENLGKAAKEFGMHVLQISTNFIFNGQQKTPYVESAGADPLSVYGMSKWQGELRLLAEYPEACIIRTSWLFGRGGKNFISSILETMKQQKIVRASSDQYGRPTYSKDLAEAILPLLSQRGVFHFANQGALSRYEVACDLKAEAKKRGMPLLCEELVPVRTLDFAMPAKRPDYAVLCTQKIELLMPIRSWKNIISEYLDDVS